MLRYILAGGKNACDDECAEFTESSHKIDLDYVATKLIRLQPLCLECQEALTIRKGNALGLYSKNQLSGAHPRSTDRSIQLLSKIPPISSLKKFKLKTIDQCSTIRP